MGPALRVFVNGSVGVFFGMALTYATIRIAALAAARLSRDDAGDGGGGQ